MHLSQIGFLTSKKIKYLSLTSDLQETVETVSDKTTLHPKGGVVKMVFINFSIFFLFFFCALLPR